MSLSKGVPGASEAWGVMAHLWRLLQAVSDESSPALQALGLTPKALGVLAAVEAHPFPAELARQMVLPPPTVTYIVKHLEAQGFVERRAEPRDLRKFRLVVTAEGRRALQEGSEAVGSFFATRLARLTPEELAAFERIAERLAAS
jgi:DNA-binding MarR family transcriptional regulator